SVTTVVLACLDFDEETADLGAHEVAGGDIAQGQAQRREFPSKVLGVGKIAFGSTSILLRRYAITIVLPVLRKQDEGRGIGRLQRQHERQRRKPQCRGVEA